MTNQEITSKDSTGSGSVIKKTPEKKTSLIREIIQFAIIALFIVLPFRLFIAQPFIVNGSSMVPTFISGQYLIVDEISYTLKNPKRGDVIIFKYPLDQSKYFIKRVIGLPGETVSIQDGAVTIINKDHPEGFTLSEPYITRPKKDTSKRTLEPTEYFVMGDNRLESSDSRIWGPVERDLIIGRPLLRLYPINTLSVLPGEKKLGQ